jgi:hypothetical protein
MNNAELSNAFDTMLNSYWLKQGMGVQNTPYDIRLDEYEKSIFLTKAQNAVITGLYTGSMGASYEAVEQVRRYLEKFINTRNYTSDESIPHEQYLENTKYSYRFALENDLMYIVLENAIYDSEIPCVGGNIVNVQPMTHDNFNKVRRNPFRGVTKYKAVRMDTAPDCVDIFTLYPISSYMMKYIRKPLPIILVDLQGTGLSIDGRDEVTEIESPSVIHELILDKAVSFAAASRMQNLPKDDHTNK